MKYIIFFISLFSPFLELKSQDSIVSLHIAKTIKGSFQSVSCDNLGNIYLVTSSNQIKKYNQNFDSITTYNRSSNLGDIFSIDVNNPLKIIVFYKDFATITQLDRTLNAINTIDLRQKGILSPKLVVTSYNNAIWVLDDWDRHIKQLDDYGNVVLDAIDCRQFLDINDSPTDIIDSKGLFYVYSILTGWYVFDHYGSLKNHFSVAGWKDIAVQENILMGRDSSGFISMNPNELYYLKRKSTIKTIGVRKITVHSPFWFYLKQNSLDIYKAEKE